MLRRLHPRCSLWLNAALALFCAAAFLLVLLWPLRSLSAGAEYSPEERSLMEALESGELIRLPGVDASGVFAYASADGSFVSVYRPDSDQTEFYRF